MGSMANANRAANGATQQATRNNDDEQCAQMPTARDGQAAVEQHLSALAETLFPARKELPRIPQQARSREKRDDLLKATATLFMERGYAQTTSDDIAAAAGVSVGTFYNYFRNKRQALMTLAIERLDEIFGNIQLAQMDFSHDNHRDDSASRHGGVERRAEWATASLAGNHVARTRVGAISAAYSPLCAGADRRAAAPGTATPHHLAGPGYRSDRARHPDVDGGGQPANGNADQR